MPLHAPAAPVSLGRLKLQPSGGEHGVLREDLTRGEICDVTQEICSSPLLRSEPHWEKDFGRDGYQELKRTQCATKSLATCAISFCAVFFARGYYPLGSLLQL